MAKAMSELERLQGIVVEAAAVLREPDQSEESIETAWREIEEAAARRRDILEERAGTGRCVYKSVEERDSLSIIEGGKTTLKDRNDCQNCDGRNYGCEKFTRE